MSCSEPRSTTTDSESQQEPAHPVTYIELPASSSSSSDERSTIVPPTDEPPENLPFTVGANIGVTKTKFTLKQDSPRQRGVPSPRQYLQQLDLLAFDLGVDSQASTSSSSGSITASHHVGDPATSETASSDCPCPPVREDDIGDAEIEYTLCIIKPEAMKYRAAIEARIEAEGFRVCGQRLVHLTEDEATDFYLDKESPRDKETLLLIQHLASGPVLAMILSRVHAIDAWKRLAGPRGSNWQQTRSGWLHSIRGSFGTHQETSEEPVVHASEDKRSARREIHFFFPDHELDDVSVEARLKFYKREIKSTLLEGLVKCFHREPKPKNPIKWLGYWLLDNDPKAPRFHCYFEPPTGEEDDSQLAQSQC
ncbi:hypothetical protein TKK_0003202 [Trichogramma kaykai]